jgi:Uma2 family endonuclease
MTEMSLAEPEILTRRDPYRFGNGVKPVLQVGTLGWSTEDLQDPEIRFLWDQGRYEIIEGVLTVMPPAYFRGGKVANNLKFILRSYLVAHKIRAAFSGEVDIAAAPPRVLRADGVVVLGDDLTRFEALRFDIPNTTWEDHILTLPPPLVIESISEGHEEHDRVTKRKWYARFKVPHYWIVDGFARKLECLRLSGDGYDVDAVGAQSDTVEPPSFPGLKIPLREVWET